MASIFTHFLIKLGEDPQLLEDFKNNPDDVMEKQGLTPAERALLWSGDAKLIRLAIVNDPGHKEAMGIPSDQNLPAKMPMIVHP